MIDHTLKMIVSNSKKILEVAQKYEDAKVENFKRMADAIIDVKIRDPDELEKRRNNRMRRCLKGIVGGALCLGWEVGSREFSWEAAL